MTSHPGPGTLETVSLLAEVANELVVTTARDTHVAWLDRLSRWSPRHGVVTGSYEAHRAIATSVYGGIGWGLRGARFGADLVADRRNPRPTDRRLENHSRGRFVRSAVNGLIGDRLASQRPEWALPLTIRHADADVATDAPSLERTFPNASPDLVVFLHGLCENESYWQWQVDTRGPGYPQALAGRGWTPLMVRANTGLPLRVNGATLASTLQELVDNWPVPVRRVALIGHSMGGLIMRAACAVRTPASTPWTERVSDVVTLGTPHLGAPLAAGVGHAARTMGRLPETGAFGRILDWRSRGVHDLVAGLDEDVPSLPHARYRLVAATVTRSPRHPVGRWLGDVLVREESAYGTSRHAELFPGADVLHVPSTEHMGLLNHPQVHQALEQWLARP